MIINQMRNSVVNAEIKKFAAKWYLKAEYVKYEVHHYKDEKLENESELKNSADYASYKKENKDALLKFQFMGLMIGEFKNVLIPENSPLLN